MDAAKLVTREELIEYLKARIKELEEELSMLKALLELVEKGSAGSGALPGEKVEEVKVGRRRIAKLYRGESHMRLVFEEPMPLPEEVEAYLKSVEDEIRGAQAKSGAEAQDLAKMTLEEAPGGGVIEIRFTGLYTTIEHLKVRAALKYAAETIYEFVRAAKASKSQ
jgi:DNA-binding protein YbaB